MDFRNDDEVVEQYIEESIERIQEVEDGLLSMERDAPAVKDKLVHCVFRSVHSVKAGANLLSLRPIEELAHRMEHILQRFRKNESTPTPENISVLLEALDAIRILVLNLDECNNIMVTRELKMLDAILDAEPK